MSPDHNDIIWFHTIIPYMDCSCSWAVASPLHQLAFIYSILLQRIERFSIDSTISSFPFRIFNWHHITWNGRFFSMLDFKASTCLTSFDFVGSSLGSAASHPTGWPLLTFVRSNAWSAQLGGAGHCWRDVAPISLVDVREFSGFPTLNIP